MTQKEMAWWSFLAIVLLMAILLDGCAAPRATGDAGCIGYAEARLAMPRAESLDQVASISAGGDRWAHWVADLDDRMTGICAGRR